jgi:hypothetical protein
MRLTLGSRTHDLTTRALVMGTDGRAAADGADVVDVGAAGPVSQDRPPVPVCVLAADDASVGRALAWGAELIRLPSPSAAALASCAAAGATVLVGAGDVIAAATAGLPPDRILPAAAVLDVTGVPCPLAATVAGVLRGARVVRTDDVRGARRVRDVLAAIMEAEVGTT